MPRTDLVYIGFWNLSTTDFWSRNSNSISSVLSPMREARMSVVRETVVLSPGSRDWSLAFHVSGYELLGPLTRIVHISLDGSLVSVTSSLNLTTRLFLFVITNLETRGPLISVQLSGVSLDPPVHLNPSSTLHSSLHPSYFFRFPSSQSTSPILIPSPHISTQSLFGSRKYPDF